MGARSVSVRFLRLAASLVASSAAAAAQTQLWKYDHPNSDAFGGLAVFADVDGDGIADFAAGDYDDLRIYVVSGKAGAELRQIDDPAGCGFGAFPGAFDAGDIDGNGHPDLIATDPYYSTSCIGYDSYGALYRFDLTNGKLLESNFGIKFHAAWFQSMGFESGVGPTSGKVDYWYSAERFDLFFGWKSAAVNGGSGGFIDLAPIGAIHGVGDLDGDGSADFSIFSAQLDIYSGKNNSKIRTLGYAAGFVNALGDTNGDGVNDFGVSQFDADGTAGSRVGKLFVHSGAAGTPLLRTIEGSLPDSYLGGDFIGAGDVDGDGFADYAVTEAGFHDARFPEGVVHVYSGATGFELARIGGAGHVGAGLAGAVDLNGDGIPDLVTVAYGASANLTAWALDRKPVVVAVTPQRGRYDSMPTVAVLGANFTGSVAVDFDGVASPSVTVVSRSELSVVVPSSATGPARVTVTTSVGSGSLDPAYWFTPAVRVDGDFRPGGSVTLRVWNDVGDELLGVTGVAPLVAIDTPPYFGRLCIDPFLVWLLEPSAPNDELLIVDTLPNDPALSGVTLLVQALAGPALRTHPKDGAWSNCGEIEIP